MFSIMDLLELLEEEEKKIGFRLGYSSFCSRGGRTGDFELNIGKHVIWDGWIKTLIEEKDERGIEVEQLEDLISMKYVYHAPECCDSFQAVCVAVY